MTNARSCACSLLKLACGPSRRSDRTTDSTHERTPGRPSRQQPSPGGCGADRRRLSSVSHERLSSFRGTVTAQVRHATAPGPKPDRVAARRGSDDPGPGPRLFQSQSLCLSVSERLPRDAVGVSWVLFAAERDGRSDAGGAARGQVGRAAGHEPDRQDGRAEGDQIARRDPEQEPLRFDEARERQEPTGERFDVPIIAGFSSCLFLALLRATCRDQSRQTAPNAHLEMRQCLQALTLHPATRGHSTQRTANGLVFAC
jgi:hypothetical protein